MPVVPSGGAAGGRRHAPSAFDKWKMGAMLGGSVGLVMGFLWGGVTIIRYGGGPNGPMRTLAQYMLGSGATFGYEIPDYTSCSVKDSADPHSPRQIFHVDRKCHTDGRHVTIGYRSLRESKATTNDVTQKIPQVTGEQATRLSLSIPNQATTWQLVAIPRTKIAIIPESLPFTRRQGINALHPPSSDEVCLEH